LGKSFIPLQEIDRQSFEGRGLSSKNSQGGEGTLREALRDLARFFQADNRWVSGLLRPGIFARGFSKLLVRLGDVEVVVDNFKSLGEKGVSGQDGDAFSKDFVIGRFASTEVVVVHRRQIVMNEGVGVDALDRAGQRKRGGLSPVAGCRGGQAERRTHPFAARKKRITH